MRACLLAFGLLVLAGIGFASARDVTDAERAALVDRIARFDAAMRAVDAEGLVDVLPPRILAAIGRKHGLDVEAVRRVTIDAIRDGLKGITFESFGMDLATARGLSLADGTPYLLVPTKTSIKVGTQVVSSSADTLAMMDGGRWYMLDLSQAPQVTLFLEAYPEFTGAEIGAKPKAVP